jgi:hypothetical protein
MDVLYGCLQRQRTEKCNKQTSSRIKRRQGDKSNLDTIHNKLKDLTRISWLVFRNKMYKEKEECVSTVCYLPVAPVCNVANLFKVSVHSAESSLQKRHTPLNSTQSLWIERVVKFRSTHARIILPAAPDGHLSKPFFLSVLFRLRTSLLLI